MVCRPVPALSKATNVAL